MEKPITILGFAGSLRKESYNKSIMRVALELAPAGVKIEIFDLEGIPPFNADLENTGVVTDFFDDLAKHNNNDYY